jgi:hypothetical protein
MCRPYFDAKDIISRVLFPIGFRGLIDFESPESGGEHFSRPIVADRLVRPTRETDDEQSLCSSEEEPLACLALLPLGVAWPQALPPAPVGSCPTFSP